MSAQEFRLPDVGEGLTEAEIVRWRVAPGDSVAINDTVVEIETAKATVELPSPYAGTVHELLVAEGKVVPVGTPILSIDSAAQAAEPDEQKPERTPVLIGYGVMEDHAHSTSTPSVHETPSASAATGSARSGKVLAKPPVRAVARELGVDLQQVTPTGPHGDVTRDDVRAAAGSDSDRIPVRGVQRAMAQAMTESAATAVPVSVWKDVDVSGMVATIARLRERTEARVTPLTMAALAVVHAVRRTPIINSSWHDTAEGAEIEQHRAVHLGIAVAGPRGLVVPKIADADRLDAPRMASALTDLTERAREDRITPADSLGATITITNVGVFDVDGGTPVLPPGQAAILAIGRMIERPWVVAGGLAVRPVMQVSLTFDHRIVDGQQGATFLSDVTSFLAHPDLALA